MSSVEEILELRRQLAEATAANQQKAADDVTSQRQAELDKEAARLRREIEEQKTVASLLAGAGQNPEKTATFGTERTEEEILFAHEVATASALGVDQAEIDKEVAARKAAAKEQAPAEEAPKTEEAPKAEAPRLTAAQPAANTGAKEEEK